MVPPVGGGSWSSRGCSRRPLTWAGQYCPVVTGTSTYPGWLDDFALELPPTRREPPPGPITAGLLQQQPLAAGPYRYWYEYETRGK